MNAPLRLAIVVLLLLTGVAMEAVHPAERYVEDVLSGRQVSCRWVRLAAERHRRDLERVGRGEAAFPYRFDEGQARRAIAFAEQLRHTKGEWADPHRHETRIRLEPWQQFISWSLFGWRREDGYRRFSKAYVEVARKNGKTTMAAATANYCFLADRPVEVGPEVYCVATKRDQAKIAWGEAERQIAGHPVLRRMTRTYMQSSAVTLPGTAARMMPLGQDSKTEDGLNPHFVLVDEYHAHPDHALLEVMQSGMTARRQPLVFIITTAGFDRNSVCYTEERAQAERILERSVEPVPEHVFAVVFTLDEGDDYLDERTWIKANPNLGVSVDPAKLRERVQDALQSPTKLNDVLTKNFNVWTQAQTRWIKDESWMACAGGVREEDLAGRPCFVALDLSATVDITAYALCFPPAAAGEKHRLLWRFFMPEEDLLERERRDRVPYLAWRDQGLIITTPGNVIDYEAVKQELDRDLRRYAVQEIAFDPWHAQEISNHYTGAGLPMVEIRQTYGGMAAYTAAFEKKVLGREVEHDANPVVRWMVSCTEVKSDRQGNTIPMKPRRDSSGKRIDGVVAAIMALGRSLVATDQSSVYEERGIVAI